MTTPDDNTPWVDLAIRTDYEAVLGRFILAFNEVDYRLSQVIRSKLSERGRADLAATVSNGRFAQRLETFDILLSTTKDSKLSVLPVARLRLAQPE